MYHSHIIAKGKESKMCIYQQQQLEQRVIATKNNQVDN